MRIAISGATGLIGSALCARLGRDGHQVTRLVRRATGHDGDVVWAPHAGQLDAAAIDGADAVVNLAGAGIGDKRWTDAHKRLIKDSRVQATELLARTIAGVDRPPAVFLSGSAIGVYGDRGDETLDESSEPGDGVLADVCRAWEAAAAAATERGVRVAHLRTGIVLARHGGALKKQLPLFRLGLGGRLGSGRQHQSWISLTDEVGAIVHLLTADLHGPVNLTAPVSATNAELTRTLGAVLHRPALLAVPAFALRAVLGREMADELLLSSQRVTPAALEASGYAFTHPALGEALRHELGT